MFNQLRQIALTSDQPEPVNSRAGVYLASGPLGSGLPLSYGPPIDYMATVTPHQPENSAAVSIYYVPFDSSVHAGAKLHVALFNDIYKAIDSAKGPTGSHTERKAPMAMSGVLSVVVFDVEPADLDAWVAAGGYAALPRLELVNGLARAVGRCTWAITGG